MREVSEKEKTETVLYLELVLVLQPVPIDHVVPKKEPEEMRVS